MRIVPVTTAELKELFEAAGKQAIAEFVQAQSPAKDMICQAEAYSQFQEMRVRRWVQEGLISPTRSGEARNAKKYYSRAELLALDASEKLKPMINRKVMP